jgi:hypothetical protein
VSTILKALKKLEREKDYLQATRPMPVVSHPRPAMGGLSTWFLKPWVRWGAVGLTIVALGGTSWYFYRQSRSYAPRSGAVSAAGNQHPSRQVPESSKKPSSAYIPPVAKVAPTLPDRSPHAVQRMAKQPPASPQIHPGEMEAHARLRHPGEPSLTQPNTPAPVREERRVQRSPFTEAAPGPPGRVIQRPTSQESPIKEMPLSPEVRQKVKAVSANVPLQPDTASKVKTPSEAYKNTPLLTDWRLRVHAIAWSPQPADRMAVINNRVIYEGDSVEGFTVVAIRPDDVVVREKGSTVWRVEFGRP